MSTTREQALATIRGVIVAVGRLSPDEVIESSPVTGLANVDSIMLLEIVAKVELAMDIDIDEETLFELKTVKDFVDACHRLAS